MTTESYAKLNKTNMKWNSPPLLSQKCRCASESG